MFKGFSEKDGAPLYDTKEAAIERARQMLKWNSDPGEVNKIFIHRHKRMPLWLAHLLKDTPLQFLAYEEIDA